MAFSLEVTAGPMAGQQLPISGPEVNFGRTPDNDVVISDPNLSRRHFKLIASAGGYAVEDRGSSNGTMVNGQRVEGATPLSDGDKIQAGDTVLVYRQAAFQDDGATVLGAAAVPEPAPQASQPPARARPSAAPPARADERLSARERFQQRQEAGTLKGRVSAFYGGLEPLQQKLVLGGTGLLALFLVLGIAKAATSGDDQPGFFAHDFSGDILSYEADNPSVRDSAFGYEVPGLDYQARGRVNVAFSYLSGRVTVFYDAGWIDSEDEVEIFLNQDQPLGTMEIAIKDWSRGIEIQVPYELLKKNENNVLTFQHRANAVNGKREAWAVANIVVREDPLPPADPVRAKATFELAVKTWEGRAVSPDSLYKACELFKQARDLLELAKTKPLLYGSVVPRIKACDKELNSLFNKYKFSVIKSDQYEDWEKSKATIQEALLYFPDQTDRRHKALKNALGQYY